MLKDATSLASTLQATAPREAWSGATPLAPRTRLSGRTELDLEAADKALRKRGGTVEIDLIALRAFDYAARELISVPRRRLTAQRSIEPVCTASKALPGTVLSWLRSSSSQRGSEAPVTYQSDPLSATIIP